MIIMHGRSQEAFLSGRRSQIVASEGRMQLQICMPANAHEYCSSSAHLKWHHEDQWCCKHSLRSHHCKICADL